MNLSEPYPTLAWIYVRMIEVLHDFTLSAKKHLVFLSPPKWIEEQCSAFLTEQLRIIKVPKQLGSRIWMVKTSVKTSWWIQIDFQPGSNWDMIQFDY